MSNDIANQASRPLKPYFVGVTTAELEGLHRRIGDTLENRARLNGDRETIGLCAGLWDLLISSVHDEIYHTSMREGLIEGVIRVIEELHRHGTRKALYDIKFSEFARTNKIEKLEYMFYSHKFPEDGRARLVDQSGNLVNDSAAREYGYREAVEYALRFHSALAPLRGEGTNRMPHMSIVPWNRPRTSDLDLIGRGWERSSNLIAGCTRLSPYGTGFDEQILKTYEGSENLCTHLASKIQHCRLHSGTFKCGFGKLACRPRADNTVFNPCVTFWDVEKADVLELLETFLKAGKDGWDDASWL